MTLQSIDRGFGVLLILASCGHTAGTLLWVPFMSGMFVWSLGAALAAGLLGVLNIVRAGRPKDRTVAIITAIGTGLWMLLAVAFGISIHSLFDPRALGHTIISLVLVVFSAITISRSGRHNTLKESL
jgi:hypothetical protein